MLDDRAASVLRCDTENSSGEVMDLVVTARFRAPSVGLARVWFSAALAKRRHGAFRAGTAQYSIATRGLAG